MEFFPLSNNFRRNSLSRESYIEPRLMRRRLSRGPREFFPFFQLSHEEDTNLRMVR